MPRPKRKEIYEVTDKNDERTCFRCTAGASFLKVKLKFDARTMEHYPEYDIVRAMYHCPICKERYLVTYRQNLLTPRKARMQGIKYENKRSEDVYLTMKTQAQLRNLRKAVKARYNEEERARAKEAN